MVQGSGVQPLVNELTPLEITCREKNDKQLWFVLNFTAEPQILPQALVGLPELLTGDITTENTQLPPYGVLLLEKCQGEKV